MKFDDNIYKDKEHNINEDIRTAIEELESARRFFDSVQEQELIEYAIYREKAAITRLSYLFKLAKNEKWNY